jgi:hypothetical protein
MTARTLLAAAALSAAVATAGVAHAGPASDAMAACMTKAMSDADRAALARWTFTSLSVHPAVKDLSSVTDAQRKTASQAFAGVVMRLVTVDCHAQAVAAIRSDSPIAIVGAVRSLGESAGAGLLANPAVTIQLAKTTDDLDKAKLAALYNEATKAP